MKKLLLVLALGLAFISCNEKEKEKIIAESEVIDPLRKLIYIKNKNSEGK